MAGTARPTGLPLGDANSVGQALPAVVRTNPTT